jgi:hypothetical protein
MSNNRNSREKLNISTENGKTLIQFHFVILAVVRFLFKLQAQVKKNYKKATTKHSAKS